MNHDELDREARELAALFALAHDDILQTAFSCLHVGTVRIPRDVSCERVIRVHGFSTTCCEYQATEGREKFAQGLYS